MKYCKVLIFVVLVGLVSVGAYFFVNGNKKQSSVQQSSFPQNELDTQVQIPGTSVSVSYPKQGFYGLGARVSKIEKEVVISPTAAYDAAIGSEYVMLDASYESLKDGETLESFVKSLSMNSESIDGQYSKMGVYEVINDQEFFLFKVTEDATMWNAYAINEGNIYHFVLSYRKTDGKESLAAYEHNNFLFKEIISHISF